MKIRHDYRAEIGLPAAEKPIPWPWTAAVFAALMLGIGWFAASSRRSHAGQLAHRHSPTLVTSHRTAPGPAVRPLAPVARRQAIS